MRTISLSVDYLEASLSGKLKGDDARFLEYLRGSALKMTALLDGMLLYAKLGEAKTAFRSSIDVRGVLEAVLENLRIPIGEAGATVSFADLP